MGGYGDKMFSAQANHSSVANRTLAELALEVRLISLARDGSIVVVVRLAVGLAVGKTFS